ncbi:hypothetical protein BK133_01030 [Paenibacillus sp. FSL H8-0548]|uniref:helix-turn-helix domain-containing protein n=1 Tax=Paenibacillus sp. FSL H8-0548 TaxID=1920422 RepID=UPI000970121C|nr:helix-turn-helix transcriptional regulator [Paenibacillus sp. FSL H8-0548]OMF38818.1 hypothetical protein BK133_01030 [Paenibacillus sp. FSL H8-0548]
MSIGSRIKEQRARLGISQQKLANEIGVSVDTIRSLEIERANPSVDTLSKLADLFDCTLDYLVGRSDDPQTYRKVTWSELKETLNSILEDIAEHDPDSVEIFKKKIETLPLENREITDDEIVEFDDVVEAFSKKFDEIEEKEKGTQ